MDRLASKVGADSLSLALVEYETNPPDKGDYLCFDAQVSSAGFSGASRFWVARSDLDVFLAEVEAFDRSLRGSADIRCGWGQEELFSVEFFPHDRLGHVGVKVRIGAAKPARRTSQHSVSVEFEVEPMALSAFAAALRVTIERRA